MGFGSNYPNRNINVSEILLGEKENFKAEIIDA